LDFSRVKLSAPRPRYEVNPDFLLNPVVAPLMDVDGVSGAPEFAGCVGDEEMLGAGVPSRDMVRAKAVRISCSAFLSSSESES
jgi:hypothetical protein